MTVKDIFSLRFKDIAKKMSMREKGRKYCPTVGEEIDAVLPAGLRIKKSKII